MSVHKKPLRFIVHKRGNWSLLYVSTDGKPHWARGRRGYGWTKKKAERLAEKFGGEVCVVL